MHVDRGLLREGVAQAFFLCDDKADVDDPSENRHQEQAKRRIPAQGQTRKDERVAQINRVARIGKDPALDQGRRLEMRDDGGPVSLHLPDRSGHQDQPHRDQQGARPCRQGDGQNGAAEPGHDGKAQQPNRREINPFHGRRMPPCPALVTR